LNELPSLLAHYLEGAEGIAFRIGKHPNIEPLVLKTWSAQSWIMGPSHFLEVFVNAPTKFLKPKALYSDASQFEKQFPLPPLNNELKGLAIHSKSGLCQHQNYLKLLWLLIMQIASILLGKIVTFGI
jgi:hypothetical protein